MGKAKHQELLLILGFVLGAVLMTLPAVYMYFYHDITGAPEAVNGSVDLSQADQTGGKIYLDGQWEFYWNRFIASEPEQIAGGDQPAQPDMLLQVPDSWSKYEIDGDSLPSSGFGSYKLILTGYSYARELSLYIPDFGSAYRVFVDGQLAAESGILSKDINKIFTVPESEIYPVSLSADKTHTVVIEVATTRFAGLYMTPVLSDYHKTIAENTVRNAIRFILFGVAIFSFLNLISMYASSIRRKQHSFWMPVMFFFILLRIMLTTEFYSIWQPILFFNISYEAINELMYFTTFALKYLLMFLVQEQCGIAFTKKEKAGFLSYYIGLYLIYLFAPQNLTNQYLAVIIPMLTYVLDIYLFIRIFRARKILNKLGMVIFWGAILVIMGITLDSYYINGKIYMNSSLALLCFFTVFAFILSWVYSSRMGDLYDDFTQTSSQLELANSQIIMQKEYYESLSAQMNEIREIKHDIHHFTGVMNRLADEGNLVQLRTFLSEYSEKTITEQLPVFCRNVVANSIIGYCYLRAKKYGIPFVSRCDIDRQITLNDSDLCIVLGNALENAIDACRLMDDTKVKFISIEAETTQGKWLFKVRNSYNGILEIKDGRYVSSKGGKSHGLGIPNIERVVEQYGGVVIIEHTDEVFAFMAALPAKMMTDINENT